MEIRIGIANAPREVSLDIEDDVSIEDLKAEISLAHTEERLLWLTEKKGRQTAIPAANLAYFEIGKPGEDQRIGFS